jgi:bifunctional enzyme CysN/CysC
METLKLAIVGHVDHGKSTLVGRLLHETGALPEGKVEKVQAMSERRGMPFEWAFVIDAMQAERDQGITIDTTQIRFRTARRHYVLIDAPGHKQFLKNMVSGAASADAVILVVDAHEGVQEQTRRHAYLLKLLGIRNVVVALNKMDLTGYSEVRYAAVRDEVKRYLASIGVKSDELLVLPVAARDGVNLGARGAEMPWYRGPTLLEALDNLPQPAAPADAPLRLWLQDIYKFDERRILAGRIESGRLTVGERVLFSPSNVTARVASLESWNAPAPRSASAGQSVGFTLDEDVFVERGHVVSHPGRAPLAANAFRAHLFWLGQRPLAAGQQYRLRHGTAETVALVERIERVVNTDDLSSSAADEVVGNGVAEVVLRTRGQLALDSHADNPITGRFVLVDGELIVGGGIISAVEAREARQLPKSANLFAVEHRVRTADRMRRNGHRGAILWFTGLSGAGKSTLAVELERLLFAKGYQVFLLDGDNLRAGLNADLGFSPEDRAENIRRVGEVAALFAEAGMIVITAFISPYRADRDRVRNAHRERFHEIYINASLEVCEKRDTKGLYRKARAGQIPEFTGVSAPYEAPLAPELEVKSGEWPLARCLAELMLYVQRHLALPLETNTVAHSEVR